MELRIRMSQMPDETRDFPLCQAEIELIECRAVMAELWDVCIVKRKAASSELLTAFAKQMYPSGENQDAV